MRLVKIAIPAAVLVAVAVAGWVFGSQDGEANDSPAQPPPSERFHPIEVNNRYRPDFPSTAGGRQVSPAESFFADHADRELPPQSNEARDWPGCNPLVERSCADIRNHRGKGSNRGKRRERKACASASNDEFTCHNPRRGEYVGAGYACGGDRELLCAEGLLCGAGDEDTATCIVSPRD